MNKNDAHLYLPFVQALAEGKQLQHRHNDEDMFEDIDELPAQFMPRFYRIKPQMEWYRVAAFRDRHGYFTSTADARNSEEKTEKDPDFLHWIGKRVEYEVYDKTIVSEPCQP